MPAWAIFSAILIACIAVSIGAARTYCAASQRKNSGEQQRQTTGLTFAVIYHDHGSRMYRKTLERVEGAISDAGHSMTMLAATSETVINPVYYDALLVVAGYDHGGINASAADFLQSNQHHNTALVVTGRKYSKSLGALRAARAFVCEADFSSGIAIGGKDSDGTQSERIRALMSMVGDHNKSRRRDSRSRRPITWISWRSRSPQGSRRHA